MNGRPVAIGAALVALLAIAWAEAPQPMSLTFTSIPLPEKVGASEHKVFPYRGQKRMFVVVQDRIVCGQKPVNPGYDLVGNRLHLHYDLTDPPAGVTRSCTAHSSFDLEGAPEATLEVSFAGGKEPYVVAHMIRCPGVLPHSDVWDCMIPEQ